MMVKQCILTGVDLTDENDSKAHVIPSVLGGRLKPKGILSAKANGIFNDKFDYPLIREIYPFMALLGGARDRGENTPIKMSDREGNPYRVVFGKPLELAAPIFEEEEKPEGKEYRIHARTTEEARTLLGRVKKAHPGFDIEKALEEAVMQESYVNGPLHGRGNIGPNVFFPATFVMASVFASHHGMAIHPDFKAYVDSFEPVPKLDELDGKQVDVKFPPDTFYWEHSSRWFTVPAEVSHVLCLYGDPHRKQAIFYAEIFNLPGIAVVLPYAGEAPKLCTYGVDVVEGKEVEVKVDEAFLRAVSWKESHEKGSSGLMKIIEMKLGSLLKVAQLRGQNHAIGEILDKELGPLDGRVLSAEDVGKVSRTVAEFLARQIVYSNS